VEFSGDIKESRDHAKQALKLMAAHGIPPTPKNYTIWYAYVTGSHHELNRVLDTLVDEEEAFTESRSDEIFSQFFGRLEEVEAIEKTGQRIEVALGELTKLVGVADDGATKYGETLENFAGELSKESPLEDLRLLVNSVMQETREMHEHNKLFASQLKQSSREIITLKKSLDTVRQESLTDALTGIANRKAFDMHLRNAVRDAMESGDPLSLLMVDIDFFKKFNDKYGHQVGDEVLHLVGRILERSVREGDTAARFGGEEFVTILPGTSHKDAMGLAERIRSTIATRKLHSRQSGEDYGTITLSIGVALYEPGEPVRQLIKRADTALYAAKEEGRNKVISAEE